MDAAAMDAHGASSPDVATAKYAGIIACMILIGYHHGLRSPNQSMPHFLASAFSQLLYQLAFTFCLLLTDAAKALLLISLAPLWAALFGYFALGEKLPRRTLIALGVCMCACPAGVCSALVGCKRRRRWFGGRQRRGRRSCFRHSLLAVTLERRPHSQGLRLSGRRFLGDCNRHRTGSITHR